MFFLMAIEALAVAREPLGLATLGATGELGGHKGYGLAKLVDILSGVLAGAGFGHQKAGDQPPAI